MNNEQLESRFRKNLVDIVERARELDVEPDTVSVGEAIYEAIYEQGSMDSRDEQVTYFGIDVELDRSLDGQAFEVEK